MKQKITKDGVPFTQISNALLNDEKLSFKAKGMYCYMYSKPNDWNFTASSIAKQMKDGRDSVLGALNELKESGWITHSKHADGSGEYMIHVDPKSENPELVNPTVGKPDRINNKDTIQTKKNTNNDVFDSAIHAIAYLTEKTNRKFTAKNPKGQPTEHAKTVIARLKDGYTIEQCKQVIDIKTSQWLKDENMKKHLNPTTLFRPSNFSKYLDEYVPDIKKQSNPNNPLDGYKF